MSDVRPKKSLGQHFLADDEIAERIASIIAPFSNNVVEVGPGMGVLTRFLLQKKFNVYAVELDRESVAYLHAHYPQLKDHLINEDFLQVDFNRFPQKFSVIGNFPYNISTQILFKILDHRDQVEVVAGMFQKEVAERVVSPPGNKDYGILSVLMQVWFEGEYLFTVEPEKFNPPPRVRSGVIRFVRNDRKRMDCDEIRFKQVVKQAFNQRRKTLRNSLRNLVKDSSQLPYASERPEQLAWKQFEEITLFIERQ